MNSRETLTRDEIYDVPGPARLMNVDQFWTYTRLAGLQPTPACAGDVGLLAVVPRSVDPADWPAAATAMLDIDMPDWPSEEGANDARILGFAKTQFRLSCGLPRGLKLVHLPADRFQEPWQLFAGVCDPAEAEVTG